MNDLPPALLELMIWLHTPLGAKEIAAKLGLTMNGYAARRKRLYYRLGQMLSAKEKGAKPVHVYDRIGALNAWESLSQNTGEIGAASPRAEYTGDTPHPES